MLLLKFSLSKNSLEPVGKCYSQSRRLLDGSGGARIYVYDLWWLCLFIGEICATKLRTVVHIMVKILPFEARWYRFGGSPLNCKMSL